MSFNIFIGTEFTDFLVPSFQSRRMSEKNLNRTLRSSREDF
jgi:hypothetical protein